MPALNSKDVVQNALSFLGVPYLWGGNGYSGVDCSGLMQQSYKQAGIDIPRVAQDQYNASTKIEASELKPGDMVFISNTNSKNNVTHVVMYIGDGKTIEAPRSGDVVKIRDLAGRSNIVGYGTFNANANAYDGTTPTDNSTATPTGLFSGIGEWFNNVLSNVVKFSVIVLIAVLAFAFLFKAFE